MSPKVIYSIDFEKDSTTIKLIYLRKSIDLKAKARILLDVIMYNDEMKDQDRIKTIIPFQIAYAVSIHKAQGLEFSSVKIVIPSNNAEKITKITNVD